MAENTTILGIDPGLAGGLAWVCGNETHCENMPQGGCTEIFDRLKEIVSESSNVVCYLEDVGQGMPNQSSKATATFARHNGHLEMALYALSVKTIKVTPQKWQKALGMGNSKGVGKTDWKNHLKAEAKRLFPKQPVTLKTADALLICEYGRRMEK